MAEMTTSQADPTLSEDSAQEMDVNETGKTEAQDQTVTPEQTAPEKTSHWATCKWAHAPNITQPSPSTMYSAETRD